jgi:hypothetical protein
VHRAAFGSCEWRAPPFGIITGIPFNPNIPDVEEKGGAGTVRRPPNLLPRVKHTRLLLRDIGAGAVLWVDVGLASEMSGGLPSGGLGDDSMK